MAITLKQAGALGGTKRWKGKTKKERSEAMREVALARYHKAELATQRSQTSADAKGDTPNTSTKGGDESPVTV